MLTTSNVNRSYKRKWFHTEKKPENEAITDANSAYDELHANTPAQAESQVHSLEQAAGDIDCYMDANKTETMCFKQEGANSTQSGNFHKLVYRFTFLGSNISSTESDGNIRLSETWISFVK